MRAATLTKAGFEVGERTAPTPTEGKALIRTVACGICGSDLHRFHETTQPKPQGSVRSPVRTTGEGLVLGHEFCGELLDYGPGTTGAIRPGRLVVSFPCIKGVSGPEVLGFSQDYYGGFGELMLLQADFMVEVPNGLSAEHAALTEPMAVGEHAVVMSDIESGDAAMVVGCGPVGLAVIAALRARGIGPIVAVDFAAKRRTFAELLGADVIIDPAKTSPYESWAEFGVDPQAKTAMLAYAMEEKIKHAVIFECVGAPGVLAAAVAGAPIGGRVIVVGACNAEEPIHSLNALVKEIDIRFCNAYTFKEFSTVLRRIADGAPNVAPLITRKIALEQVQDAFEALANPTDVKILLRHSGPA
jgi:threonine dehydrogenase-like Zn-dependent dehydrogenase